MAEYQSGSGKTPPMYSTARLVRETDMMRTGIESDLVEITGESLTIRTKEELAVDDGLKIDPDAVDYFLARVDDVVHRAGP